MVGKAIAKSLNQSLQLVSYSPFKRVQKYLEAFLVKKNKYDAVCSPMKSTINIFTFDGLVSIPRKICRCSTHLVDAENTYNGCNTRMR